MYSILRNSALASKSSARTIAELEEIETQLGLDGVDIPLTIDGTAAERLRHIISDEANGIWSSQSYRDRSIRSLDRISSWQAKRKRDNIISFIPTGMYRLLSPKPPKRSC
jgi:hypothetical protein